MQTDDGSRADRVCKEEKARVWRPEQSQNSQSQQSQIPTQCSAVRCGRAGLAAACALLVPFFSLVLWWLWACLCFAWWC